MPKYFPVMLDVRNRSAIVVGGDRAAAEKAAALSACGAHVSVLSLDFCEEFIQQAQRKQVTLLHKAYEPGDLAGAFVVIAATFDPQLIAALWTETQERGQLLNIVDVPASCSFLMPSVLRRGPLSIAVSTEGTSPGLAKRIRHSLEDMFPPAYADYMQLAAHVRTLLRNHGLSYQQRDDFFNDYFTSNVLVSLVEGQAEKATSTTVALLQRYGLDVSADELEIHAGSEEKQHDRSDR